MLTIKLAKVGKKNKKMFRIIISEKSKDPYGKALEILGSYNPYSKELKVKADRVKHWIGQGSGMTPSINNLFVENKIIETPKKKNSKPGTPNKRKLEKIEKAKKKEEEVKAEAEAKKVAEEKPVENSEINVVDEENKTEVVEQVPEEKSSKEAVEKVEEKAEEKTEEKTEEKAEENSGEKTE